MEQSVETPVGREAARQMRSNSRSVALGLALSILFYLILLTLGFLPAAVGKGGHAEPEGGHAGYVPPLWSAVPFAGLLLSIAVLPLIPKTTHWWHRNRNRFLVACVFGAITLLYYWFSHPGGLDNHFTHQVGSGAGISTAWAAFSNAVLSEYIPFIVLLFSLYVISGGIGLKGDLAAHPATNTGFMAAGTLLASFIGTTGAAMVLIRPLLLTNQERKYRTHTIIFFIFTVCNCGGLLLPIGDPPLFLGYLRGVPFTWTLGLWPYWLGVNLILLVVYFVWDSKVYQKEKPGDIWRDEILIEPLRLAGGHNLALLAGIVFCVAFIVPGQPFLGTEFKPPVFLRESVMCLLVLGSLLTSDPLVRLRNRFNYEAIVEVAALFGGIFVCMQAPIEILHARGGDLGVNSSAEFFWATGILSSFLDNAPTYVVFFETARSMGIPDGGAVLTLITGHGIAIDYLVPISLGAVFMGANSYIGNGPNFMVKSIAEQNGVRMPSFFGYMLYSAAILVPIFAVLTFLL